MSRDLVEKVIVCVLTRASHLCVKPDGSNICPSIHLRSILIPFLHLQLRLSSALFPLGVTTKTLFLFVVASMRATRTAHLTFLYFTAIILGEEHWSWSSPSCSFLHSPLRLRYLSQHPILKKPSLCSSLNIWVQVTHPQKTTDIVIQQNCKYTAKLQRMSIRRGLVSDHFEYAILRGNLCASTFYCRLHLKTF